MEMLSEGDCLYVKFQGFILRLATLGMNFGPSGGGGLNIRFDGSASPYDGLFPWFVFAGNSISLEFKGGKR